MHRSRLLLRITESANSGCLGCSRRCKTCVSLTPTLDIALERCEGMAEAVTLPQSGESLLCQALRLALEDSALSCNELGDDIAGLLAACCGFQHLALARIGLTHSGLRCVAAALQNTLGASLVVLDLSNNRLGDKAIPDLCAGLLAATHMQRLHLRGCTCEAALARLPVGRPRWPQAAQHYADVDIPLHH
jgi:hypothetical protein